MLIRYPDILRLTRTRHFERGQLAERLLTKRRWNKFECCCLWRQNLRHDLCLTLWLGCESHVITNWTEVRRRAFETKTKAANAFTIFGSFVSRAQSLGVLQLMNGRVYCVKACREEKDTSISCRNTLDRTSFAVIVNKLSESQHFTNTKNDFTIFHLEHGKWRPPHTAKHRTELEIIQARSCFKKKGRTMMTLQNQTYPNIMVRRLYLTQKSDGWNCHML